MKPPPTSHEEWSSIDPVSPSDLHSLQQRAADRPLKVLSISCCDGIASISAAFSGLPVEATHIISEIDAEALAVSKHRCKQADFVGDLRALDETCIRELVVKHDPDFIFVSGGTPCKQLSRASNDKSGLHGKDSGLFWAFRDVIVAAASAGKRTSTPCFFLWENVLMREAWLQQAEAALGFQAVIVDAAHFGHHRRPRVWIANWTLQAEAARWLRPSPSGRQEIWIPFSARRLPDLGRIFAVRFTRVAFAAAAPLTSQRASSPASPAL